MNTDTQAMLQYLATLIEAVESRGVEEGTFMVEAINEVVEVNRDPDFKGDMRPSGKTLLVARWRWADPVHVAMRFTSEGERVDMSDGNG